MRKYAWAILLGVGLATSAPVFAADLAPAPTLAVAPDTWHFEATLDGWAPSLSANLGVLNFPTSSVHADLFQILQHLEGIAPFTVVGYNDNFMVGANLFWVRLGLGSTFGPGAFGGVNANATINQTILDVYGGVRLPIASPNLSIYGTLGARVFDVNGSLTLQSPVLGFSRTASQGRTWADEIVGVNARYRIDDKWFLKLEANAGGYSGSATWLVYPAVGYKWNPSLTTSVGYRALYAFEQSPANIGTGSFRFQETLYGPELDVTYNF